MSNKKNNILEVEFTEKKNDTIESKPKPPRDST